ncbi:MAG: S-layer homology domain-containing protein [Cyanobacteriota bacterium]|nr:S-layer homology domain-containing protein [Cyanobacteriota bacterium]
MTNIPPKPPSRSRPVERDEWIAIFVALATLGSVFFWTTTQGNNGFNLFSKPILSSPESEAVDSPDTNTEKSIFSLGTPQLNTLTGKPASNFGQALSSSEELETSLATLTPITDTFEQLETSVKGLDRANTEAETTLELAKSPKAPQVGKGLATLGIGSMLSGSPMATPSLPLAPPISSLTTESPTATSPSPEEVTFESPGVGETATSPSPEATSESPGVSEIATSSSPEVENTDSPTATSPSPEQATSEIPLVGTAAPSPETSLTDKIKFSDVPDNFWASNFIQPLRERDVIAKVDNDKFEPDKPVTRAEFATQIPKVFEEKSTESSVNYEDVPADSPAQKEIQTATKSGFLSGYPGNIFRPEQEVPRLQVLVALASGLNLEIPSNPDKVLSIYKDKEKIPDWAKKKVAAATATGLVVNHPDVTILNPNKPATRAEVTAMFYQALVRLGRVEEVSSKYIVTPKN